MLQTLRLACSRLHPKQMVVTALAAMAWGLAGMGHAANPVTLDDSRTQTVPPDVQMQWRPQTPENPTGGMQAWLRVNVHLDTSQWRGQNVRVYLALPPDDRSRVEASWTGTGRLRDGTVYSGERTLIYAGTISANALTDQWTLRLRTGTDWQSNARRLQFRFELEPN
ncbi:hypothetical protein [Hydrogenophaga sp. 5NK40-0174]|uniref:hypothetical protein n=1 Tax=Hydrogenophaga sp. 5NK40-0174 TaxID=3127649 RepID=UPI003342CD97